MAAGSTPAAPRPGQGALGAALRRALAGYRQVVDRELSGAGFADRRFPESRVLVMCSGPGETTISDIGRALGITRQGASKIVAGLRDRGYLTVTPSAGDGREKILTLTARAVEHLLTLHQAATDIETRLRNEIGAGEVEQFFRILDVIAGGAGGTAISGDSPAMRALQWKDAEDLL